MAFETTLRRLVVAAAAAAAFAVGGVVAGAIFIRYVAAPAPDPLAEPWFAARIEQALKAAPPAPSAEDGQQHLARVGR